MLRGAILHVGQHPVEQESEAGVVLQHLDLEAARAPGVRGALPRAHGCVWSPCK